MNNLLKSVKQNPLRYIAVFFQLLAICCLIAASVYLAGNIIEYNKDYADYCEVYQTAACYHGDRSFMAMLGLVFFFLPLLSVVSSVQFTPKKLRKPVAALITVGYLLVWVLAIYLAIIT